MSGVSEDAVCTTLEQFQDQLELTICHKTLSTIDNTGTLMRASNSSLGVAGHSNWVRVPVQGSEKVALADMITSELEVVAQRVRYVETDEERNGGLGVDGGNE